MRDLSAGDPAILFDGRIVELRSEPRDAGGKIGLWADVVEVTNAADEPFYGPKYGEMERVSLRGATDPLSGSKLFAAERKEFGHREAMHRLRERRRRRDSGAVN